MNMRVVVSSTVLLTAVIGAVFASQHACAADADANASAPAPGMRYEAHLNAGGVAPATLPLPHAPAGKPDDAKTGEALFSSMNCDGCHGGGATGWEGPSLVDGRWRYGGADEEVFQSIFYGRPKGMPSYGGVLGVDGVWLIVAYLKSQPVPDIVPTTNYEELAKPVAATVASAAPAPGTPASAPADASLAGDPRAKLARYNCTACHAIDHKVVGPAFRDVAAKYRGQAGAAERLEAKVKNGGSGVWGDIPMPANPTVPDADLREIVQWILTSHDVSG